MHSTDVAVRQVALVADDLNPVLDDLAAVFGLEVANRDPAVAQFGLHNVVLPVGDEFLEIIAPLRPGTAAGRFLERRHGPGGYMLILQASDPGFADRRGELCGVRMVFSHDADGFAVRQFHPADTGGVFLEVNHQDGEGRWHPAGESWRTARRTDVLGGIAAVQVQAPDPAAVAGIWARLTEARAAPADESSLRFANARVDFVPLADDRGAGLSAIAVRTVDAGFARSAAAARGLLQADGSIGICGIRFMLVGPD